MNNLIKTAQTLAVFVVGALFFWGMGLLAERHMTECRAAGHSEAYCIARLNP